VGYGYIEYGYGYDSNPQSAGSANPITAANGAIISLDASQLTRSDHYHALSVGGEMAHAMTERFSVYAGGDARVRGHRQIDTADFGMVDVRAGLGYSEGGRQARVGVLAGRYFLDYQKVRDNTGLNAEYRTLLGSRNQITLGALASRFKYLPDAFQENDYDLYQGSVGWLRSVNDGRGAFGVSLLGGYEKATRGRRDGDKPFAGARLTLQNAFTERLGAFVLGGVQQGKYKDLNTSFDTRRVDTLYDLIGGVTWTFAPRWSLRPQVMYLKNKSNISLYEYKRTDISLNLRRDF
jgi:hypothetical protein